ncbi:hypothetical protein SASPL_154735 [Salvia splendens]|uniref:Rab proteins geranylgeranyltransferase component A n=1 Tax=Salvia splendens TaxID=180675 RepID=A0A8X8W0M7_SALSN|nr:hypothetical protein SASPL_154735 [Salvia splendens]
MSPIRVNLIRPLSLVGFVTRCTFSWLCVFSVFVAEGVEAVGCGADGTVGARGEIASAGGLNALWGVMTELALCVMTIKGLAEPELVGAGEVPVDELLQAHPLEGVRLASGQELSSPLLILAPSFTIPKTSPPGVESEAANCLVFFPPRSLYPEQKTSVCVLQLSSNVGICPSNTFVTYLSAVCDEAVEGKKFLNAAVNALFHIAFHGAACNSIRFTPMPDEHLHYDDILDATEKLFKELFPNEDFFATASTSDSDEHLDDGNTEPDP